MSVPGRDGAADRASPEPDAESRLGMDRREAADVRLARLEGEFHSFLQREVKYLATKEDIQKLKVWVLVGVIGGAAGIVTGIAAIVF